MGGSVPTFALRAIKPQCRKTIWNQAKTEFIENFKNNKQWCGTPKAALGQASFKTRKQWGATPKPVLWQTGKQRADRKHIKHKTQPCLQQHPRPSQSPSNTQGPIRHTAAPRGHSVTNQHPVPVRCTATLKAQSRHKQHQWPSQGTQPHTRPSQITQQHTRPSQVNSNTHGPVSPSATHRAQLGTQQHTQGTLRSST